MGKLTGTVGLLIVLLVLSLAVTEPDEAVLIPQAAVGLAGNGFCGICYMRNVH